MSAYMPAAAWQDPLSLVKQAPMNLTGPMQMPGMNPDKVQIGMPDINFGAGPDFGGGGMNLMQGAQLGLGGLQTLANLWMGFKANKLARDQFNFTKKTTEANMANTISSFNTALEDKIRSRAYVEGRPDGYADSYLDKHKLKNG